MNNEKECMWCGRLFKCSPRDYWKFLCTKCYYNYCDPVSTLINMKTFKANISLIKTKYRDVLGEKELKEHLLAFQKSPIILDILKEVIEECLETKRIIPLEDKKRVFKEKKPIELPPIRIDPVSGHIIL